MSSVESVTVAVIQCSLGGSVEENVEKTIHWVRKAAAAGAQVILPSELFEGPYFCKTEVETEFLRAKPVEGHATIAKMRALAKELGVVIPVSFFEKAGQAYYNSLVMVDADGSELGLYRKSHIPDGPGYEEKYYFRPGDTGFQVWDTRFGKIGVGICWDQWYPECARAMMLKGADLLLYPTAIGSEPHDSSLDTKDPWHRAMLGHAVSNIVPVCAANRVGNEDGQLFYGSSFCANHRGDFVSVLDRAEENFAIATFDLGYTRRMRAAWGFFRDRRPELYGALATADGSRKV
ncbi:MAG: N-carbamoylputrescine amidase [Polyangiales bacterium]